MKYYGKGIRYHALKRMEQNNAHFAQRKNMLYGVRRGGTLSIA